jgi:hypothetical protein
MPAVLLKTEQAARPPPNRVSERSIWGTYIR